MPQAALGRDQGDTHGAGQDHDGGLALVQGMHLIKIIIIFTYINPPILIYSTVTIQTNPTDLGQARSSLAQLLYSGQSCRQCTKEQVMVATEESA